MRLGVVVGAAEAGLHGSRVRTIGDGGGRLAPCYLVADAAEAIIEDVQPPETAAEPSDLEAHAKAKKKPPNA